MRQVILDTETTGLETKDKHRIIEIGCIEVINRKITDNRYHQYLNPERIIDEGALAVHGLSNEFLQDKPLFADIAEEFLAFVCGAELIIHNAPFDTGFINYELELLKLKQKKEALRIENLCQITDTLVLARRLHIGQRNSLDALCKRYKVDNSQRELHGALLDAHLLAKVYLAMTGGQASIFDQLEAGSNRQESQKISTEKEEEGKIVVRGQRREYVVLRATPEELRAHEEKLKEICS